MLKSYLEKIATDYVFERAKPYSGSEFAGFVRHDVATEAKKRTIFEPYDLKVKASVGAGNWASVPWVAFFDPVITETATKGFYVVYLINPDTQAIYLSLNQGTTEIYNEYGEVKGRQILRRRASDMRARIPKFAALLNVHEIELSSSQSLPLGYEAGHALGKVYYPGNIDDAMFGKDLSELLHAYDELLRLGGLTPIDVMTENADSSDIEEIRRFTLSKRYERAPKVRKQVLAKRGMVCEACEFDAAKHVVGVGKKLSPAVDVHHRYPLGKISENETRRYKIPDDFLVLCPTCHRLIHQQHDPGDLDQLRNRLRFSISAKTNY
jgi:5-methylcytosine-specific restriction protein A